MSAKNALDKKQITTLSGIVTNKSWSVQDDAELPTNITCMKSMSKFHDKERNALSNDKTSVLNEWRMCASISYVNYEEFHKMRLLKKLAYFFFFLFFNQRLK